MERKPVCFLEIFHIFWLGYACTKGLEYIFTGAITLSE